MTPTTRQTRASAPAAQIQPSGVVQRCACGGAAGPTGECEACRTKRAAREGTLQRRATGRAPVSEVPASVHDVLRLPGQPLDTATRTYMEPRFGHDFSRVRVHVDAQAAQSARDVSAYAYTVGQHVVFGSGQYQPGEPAGRSLLAHELAHTIQQARSASAGPLQVSPVHSAAEQEANRVMSAFARGAPIGVHALVERTPTLQRFPACASLLNAEDRGRVSERSVQAELARVATAALGGGIQRELLIPDASFQQYRDKDRVPAGGQGFADIAYSRGGVLELLEVKRATWPDAVDGERQVLNYVEKGNRNTAWKQQQGVTSVRTMPVNRFRPDTPVRIDNEPVSLGWCRDGLISFKAIGNQDQDVFINGADSFEGGKGEVSGRVRLKRLHAQETCFDVTDSADPLGPALPPTSFLC